MSVEERLEIIGVIASKVLGPVWGEYMNYDVGVVVGSFLEKGARG